MSEYCSFYHAFCMYFTVLSSYDHEIGNSFGSSRLDYSVILTHVD